MSRNKSREVAFRIGYDINPIKEYDERETLLGVFGINEKIDNGFIQELIKAVVENKAEIDAVIAANLKGFSFERIFPTDLAALRLGLAEIKYLDGQPEVVIDAVVTLAKKYGTEKSAGFVNGVLASVNDEKTC